MRQAKKSKPWRLLENWGHAGTIWTNGVLYQTRDATGKVTLETRIYPEAYAQIAEQIDGHWIGERKVGNA